MPGRKVQNCMERELKEVDSTPSPKRRLEYCIARQICHNNARDRKEALFICKPPKPPRRDTPARRYVRCVAHIEEKMYYGESKKVNPYAVCHASVG